MLFKSVAFNLTNEGIAFSLTNSLSRSYIPRSHEQLFGETGFWGRAPFLFARSGAKKARRQDPANLQKIAQKGLPHEHYAAALCMEHGSKEARTPDLSRVRRTLIPAELCFRYDSCYKPSQKKKQAFIFQIFYEVKSAGQLLSADSLHGLSDMMLRHMRRMAVHSPCIGILS